MTMHRTDREEAMLEAEARLRAYAAAINEPERKQGEERDDYHARVWAALQLAAKN